MGYVDVDNAEPEPVQAGHACSWQAIAAAVRRHAATLPAEARLELEEFSDLLDGIAKLN